MDNKLRPEILDELRWDARVDAAKVTATIAGGTAVLRGSVHTYPEKCRCEQIVKRIRGVTAVRNQIEVRLMIADYRSDETLQRLASEVLESIALLPHERPSATVAAGRVTLEGSVAFAFQKRLAEEAVGLIAGVRSIANHIELIPRTAAPIDLKRSLERRVPRKIEVSADGGRVTLSGTVRTCAERDDLVQRHRHHHRRPASRNSPPFRAHRWPQQSRRSIKGPLS